MNTYQEVEAYLYSLLPVFQRDGGKAVTRTLEPTRNLLAALGNPHKQFRSIHVGGTNGKGSVSSMLAAMLSYAELGSVGLYTSPHLLYFGERMRVDGQPMPRPAIVDWVNTHRALIEDLRPSFFELTVAMAFDWFASQGVAWAVVEVGLGGRLDSTNVLTPELAVVTNVGWDHADLLGPTLGDIAREKAGILKPGVPAVLGVEAHNTEVFAPFEQKAAELQTPLFAVSPQWPVLLQWPVPGKPHSTSQPELPPLSPPSTFRPELEGFSLRHFYLQLPNRPGRELAPTLEDAFCLDLPGSYQLQNLRCILGAWHTLLTETSNPLPSLQAVLPALAEVRKRTGLRGRFELLAEQPCRVVADVAHNEPALKHLFDHYRQSTVGSPPNYIVLAAARDKDLNKMAIHLPTASNYYVTQFSGPRALPAEQLAQALGKLIPRLEGRIRTIADPVEALAQAQLDCAQDPLNQDVLITGSVFLVAELLQQFPEPYTPHPRSEPL